VGTPSTTADIVRHWAKNKPDHVALRWGDEHLTYAELDAGSNQVAQALRSAGVGPQEPVAFLGKNSPEHVELFFGAAKLNAIPAPVNFRLAPAEIATIVNDAGAKIFVVDEEFLPTVAKVRHDLGDVLIIAIGHSVDDESYASWRSAHSADDPAVPQGPDDIAYLLYSSGTTGRPKGVQLTQSNLRFSMASIAPLLRLDGASVSLAAMPLYHIGGGGWALAGFSVGATNVLVRDVVPAEIVDLVEREGISHAFLVPAVLQLMLDVPGVEKRDLSSLRYVVYGASPISESVLQASIRTFGCRFVQAYGLTESTGSATYVPETDHDLAASTHHRLRAIGVPIPGVEALIVDPTTGDEKAVDETGEIWVRGPGVMKGYWNMPDETAETIRAGGWLRTGDAGYRDADGYLYLHDRIKDMIVSGGENVYPAEVENVLMGHPAVADAAVIGIPHDKWGETPLAVVVRAPGQALTDAELLTYCRECLAGFKCPTAVEWRDDLPRNPSGKVLKKELRSPYWAGRTRFVS
jgi:long-chain acyl-CoA synthetase